MIKMILCFILVTVASVAAVLLLFKRRKLHAFYRRRARAVYDSINTITGEGADARKMAYLKFIDPYVFEELLLLAFQRRGYKVIPNKRYSGDGGLDGQVIIDGVRIPIQAKRYKGHIKKEHVEAFARLISRKKKPFGFFIHTGRTGKGSREECFPGVRIISGSRLIALLSRQEQGQDKFHI